MDQKLKKTVKNEKSGRILGFLHTVAAFIYEKILDSAIGRFLTGYSRTQDAFDEAHEELFSSGERRKRNDRLWFRIRMWLNAQLERSGLMHSFLKFEDALLQSSVSTYGIFFLLFGVYTVVAYYMTSGLSLDLSASSDVLIGGCMIFAALPMFAGNTSLGYALRSSIFFRSLLIGLLDIREERFSRFEKQGKDHYLFALLAGLAGGVLTILIPPYRLLLGIALLCLFLLILRFPEVGMILSLIMTPFLVIASHPTKILVALVGVTLISFFFKVACGKRVISFTIVDYVVILFAFLYLLGGTVSAGGQASMDSALVYVCLMMNYFIISNLIRSRQGLLRMTWILLIPSVIVAAIGLWQYFFADIGLSYVDMTLFSDLGSRIYSTFENPNILAEYLILFLPLWIAFTFCQSKFIHLFMSLLATGTIVLCLIFTWSRGAWLGTLVALLFFFLLQDHRVFSYIILGSAPVVLLARLIPGRVARRFMSIGNGGDSSILYRLNLWKGVKAMLEDYWLSGVGVGEQAFCSVYSGYALPGVQSAVHTHSLYLQLLCAFGILGLIGFFALMILWARRAFEFYRYHSNRRSKLMVLGSVAGIIALLVMGCFDEIWYNYRIFFFFWTMMGFVGAQIRIEQTKEERSYNPTDVDRTQAEMTLYFH